VVCGMSRSRSPTVADCREESAFLPFLALMTSLTQWKPPWVVIMPPFLAPTDSPAISLPKGLYDRLDLGSLKTPEPAVATSLAQEKSAFLPFLATLPFLAPEDSPALYLSKEPMYDRLELGLLRTLEPAVATSLAQWKLPWLAMLPSLPFLALLTPKDSSALALPKEELEYNRIFVGLLSTPVPALTTSLAQLSGSRPASWLCDCAVHLRLHCLVDGQARPGEDAEGGVVIPLFDCLEKKHRQVRCICLADSSDIDKFIPGSGLLPGLLVPGVLPHLSVRGVRDPVHGEPWPVWDEQRFSVMRVRLGRQLVVFWNRNFEREKTTCPY